MVKQVLEDLDIPHTFKSADAVAPNDAGWIANLWESARTRMRMGDLKEYLLVIDEIHKIDDWSNQVKREWDADSFHDINLKVVVLGSSRLLLKSGLNESLAGRFELIRMTHWDYQEMRDAADAANISYIELNRAFLDTQAGILAETLEDGAPCPVCGSKEHPSPAELSNEAPTEKAVDATKKKADKAQSDASNASAAEEREKGRGDVLKSVGACF